MKTAGQSVDVEIAMGVAVRFNSADVDLAGILHSTGLAQAPQSPTGVEPLLRIEVQQQLNPTPDIAARVHPDILIEPDTLWLLDRAGTAVAGLRFGTWNTQINAQATPGRIVWLLRLLLPIALPARGLLAGHGAAYQTSGGRCILMSGLPNSGKTGATLSAIANGGKFLTDDLVLIDPQAGRVLGNHLPVCIAYTYLQQYPRFKAAVAPKTLARLRRKTHLLAGLRHLLPEQLTHRLLPARLAKRWINLINTKVTIELPRNALFDTKQRTDAAPIDLLVQLVVKDTTHSETEESTVDAASIRWWLAVQQDTSELHRLYALYRYAFPESSCRIIENYPATIRKLLTAFLPQCNIRSLGVSGLHPNPELMRRSIEEFANRE